jgi:hypothetical protein
MSTEPPPPVPPLPVVIPRLGRGFCWSDVVAEIERDEKERPAQPLRPKRTWKPAPVVHTTPAGDHIEVQPAEPLRWAC